MKVNILMPTYNDADSICETLDSVKNQTYTNYHLTIVIDGSSDNTIEVLKKYIEDNNMADKISYIYQENKDQLNALKNGFSKLKDKNGLIYILHSDDLFNNENVLKDAVNYFENNKDVDAIMADLNIINGESTLVGVQKVRKYKKSERLIALQGLWLGRNLLVDFAFWKYEVFAKYVFNNYLTWNTPAWLNLDCELLNIKKVDFPFIKYRVFEENYINSEIGVINVLNGELRTELNILYRYNIPMFKVQYFLFRAFNKLKLPYRVIYSKKEQRNIYKVIKFLINKRIKDEDISKYPYYESILNFFKNYNTNEVVNLYNVNEKEVYLGSDMRSFNKKMLKGELSNFYYDLFNKMNDGFSTVQTDKDSYPNVVNILKFMGVYDYVKIHVD